jgi:tRNA(fMet)-specific endonuclease VapC
MPTLAELCAGAFRSQRVEENLVRLAGLLEDVPLLAFDRPAAFAYGRLSAHLRSLGRPIPTNDMQIAAIALTRGLVLLTRDRHFDDVPDLTTESWLAASV